MPLKAGKSDATRSSNIAELIKSYKSSGKIGNTTPRDMAHAREIASAIAYGRQKGKKAKKKKAKLSIAGVGDEYLRDGDNGHVFRDGRLMLSTRLCMMPGKRKRKKKKKRTEP